MKKFDIRKTFDLFFREPISILAAGILQLVNIDAPNIFEKSVDIDFSGKNPQLTIVNNTKMYNLFQTVLYKQKLKREKEQVKR